MKNSKKFSKIALILAFLLLISAFIIFILEKTQVINLYSKPIKDITNEPVRPVNSVSYSTATNTETEEGNQIKQSLIDQANNPPKQMSSIDISLSAAIQDIKGGPLIVRAIVKSSSGTCTLLLSQGTINKEYSAEIINLGTYYGCNGFDIPASDLGNGQWQLKLKVSNGQATGEAAQKVEVAL